MTYEEEKQVMNGKLSVFIPNRIGGWRAIGTNQLDSGITYVAFKQEEYDDYIDYSLDLVFIPLGNIERLNLWQESQMD